MIIIGITGTNGAGKGTIVDFLIEKGFKHFSMRGFITEEIERRGLPVNRDSMIEVGNDLRAKNSPSYIAEQLFEQAARTGENCIIESLRTMGEVNALKQKGTFYLFAVDADPTVRFERITGRQSATDNVDFGRFLSDEKREMQSIDPNKQNLSACISAADYTFTNNGSLDDLRVSVMKVVDKIAE